MLFSCGCHVVGLGGRILSIATRAFGRYRPLTADEQDRAAEVFTRSDGTLCLALDRVRLPRRGILTRILWRLSNRRPFTTMHTIHHHPDLTLPTHTLIHELVHVWQAEQFGHRYMLEALWAQWFGEGYQVTGDHLRAWSGSLDPANREQQAVLIERYWRARHGHPSGSEPDWAPYRPFVEALHRRPSKA